MYLTNEHAGRDVIGSDGSFVTQYIQPSGPLSSFIQMVISSGLSGTMCHFNLTNYVTIGTHMAFDLLILNDHELCV